MFDLSQVKLIGMIIIQKHCLRSTWLVSKIEHWIELVCPQLHRKKWVILSFTFKGQNSVPYSLHAHITKFTKIKKDWKKTKSKFSIFAGVILNYVNLIYVFLSLKVLVLFFTLHFLVIKKKILNITLYLECNSTNEHAANGENINHI